MKPSSRASLLRPVDEPLALNLPPGSVQHINPQTINLLCALERLSPDFLAKILASHAEDAVLGGDWDAPQDTQFELLDEFAAIRDCAAGTQAWVETEFIKKSVRQLREGAMVWGCATEAQLLAKCAEVEQLWKTIKRDGYKSQVQLGTGRPADEVRLAADRNGRLLFLDGLRRLSIAKALGLTSIPARIILRHEHWAETRQLIFRYARETKGSIYQQIPHPDLEMIPARHKRDRIEILKKGLEDYPPKDKRLVDLGAHWGYMCQQFEAMGFQCTAIEKDEVSVRIMERIRLACQNQFTVWHGDIYDFPKLGEYNVVLALNVFHHFLKKRTRHKRLIEILGRLNADLIFFEPHKAYPAGQMEGAYRNYDEEEFVRFVLTHARMKQAKKLGVATDGRPIYKLWR